MKSTTLREYCILVEDNQISHIVLDPKRDTTDKLWAMTYDFHYKTSVLEPDAIPYMYSGFISLLLIAGGLILYVLFRESKKIIELLLNTYLRRAEIKNGVPNVQPDKSNTGRNNPYLQHLTEAAPRDSSRTGGKADSAD